MPTGFTLDPSGILYGSPAQPLTAALAVSVTDSSAPAQTASATLTLSIQPALTITNTTLTDAVAGSPYTAAQTSLEIDRWSSGGPRSKIHCAFC